VRLHSVAEGWIVALDQLRANKLRSGLTILGVVIGVATVMTMASIVQGLREQIVNTLEVVGPTTFRVLRFFSSAPLNPDALPKEVRIRPALRAEEATAIARLPEIHYSAIWMGVAARLEYEGTRTQPLVVVPQTSKLSAWTSVNILISGVPKKALGFCLRTMMSPG